MPRKVDVRSDARRGQRDARAGTLQAGTAPRPSLSFLSGTMADLFNHSRDLVVLVHGLLMPGAATSLLARRLRAAGFDTHSFAYASLRDSLEAVAERLAHAVGRHSASRIHFVGHSLGGLVVLTMLGRHPEHAHGRVVLLGSPCCGCAAAGQLLRHPLWKRLVGRALPAWRLHDGASVARCMEVGAIAGTHRAGLGSLLVHLDGANDGLVTVDETRLPGLADHLVMHVSHSGMLVSTRLAHRVAGFLACGRFSETLPRT